MRWMPRALTGIMSLIIAATPAEADSWSAERDGVKFIRLSDTVWMHTSFRDYPNIGPFPANGLIIIEGTSAILVDSGWTDKDARAILLWTKENTGAETTRAVFTHAHVDKMGGAGALRDSGVATYALELSNKLAVQNGLQAAEHVLPLAMKGNTISIGGVDFFFPGPGHSPDNIVANVKADGVLFGGCLIRPSGSRSLGNLLDANIGQWSEAVNAVATRFPASEIVIPTHGPPAGRELLDLTQGLAKEARSE